jgi:hypothetical protein
MKLRFGDGGNPSDFLEGVGLLLGSLHLPTINPTINHEMY